MSLNNTYQLEDIQTLPSGEQFENVYFYNDSSSAGSAEELSEDFAAVMIPLILEMQASSVSHRLVRCFSLGNPADFFERSLISVVGARSDDLRSPFEAINFTLRPTLRLVRPGSKRIGGLPDASSAFTNGVVTESTFLGYLEDVRAQMAATLDGDDGAYNPVIIKRIFDATIGENGGYRLPVTDLELLAVDVGAVLVNPRITHQTSRGN